MSEKVSMTNDDRISRIRSLFEEARKIIEHDGWSPRAIEALDDSGRQCSAVSESAAVFSLEGAVRSAAVTLIPDERQRIDAYWSALLLLHVITDSPLPLPEWSRMPGRGASEIVGLLIDTENLVASNSDRYSDVVTAWMQNPSPYKPDFNDVLETTLRLHKRLCELRGLQPGWNNGSGRAFSQAEIDETSEFLVRFAVSVLPPFEINPLGEAVLQIEWDETFNNIAIAIDFDKRKLTLFTPGPSDWNEWLYAWPLDDPDQVVTMLTSFLDSDQQPDHV